MAISLKVEYLKGNNQTIVHILLDEIEIVLRAMYTLLGIKHVEDYPPELVAKDLMEKCDITKDGRVTKDEFIHFLMKEGIYRNTVNPFH